MVMSTLLFLCEKAFHVKKKCVLTGDDKTKGLKLRKVRSRMVAVGLCTGDLGDYKDCLMKGQVPRICSSSARRSFTSL
jgi:hypothetical protein